MEPVRLSEMDRLVVGVIDERAVPAELPTLDSGVVGSFAQQLDGRANVAEPLITTDALYTEA